MGECFLIASGKGGVGKSTIAVSLAQALCARGAQPVRELKTLAELQPEQLQFPV